MVNLHQGMRYLKQKVEMSTTGLKLKVNSTGNNKNFITRPNWYRMGPMGVDW